MQCARKRGGALSRKQTRSPSQSHVLPTAPVASTIQPRRLDRSAWRELLVVLAVTGIYFLTRGLVHGRTSDALAHAKEILSLERGLHLDPEQVIQQFALPHGWLLQVANLFYLVGHLPVLIAVALWLFWAHPTAYRVFRDAFGISALLGLVIYVAYPVAPPRFLPGFVDSLKLTGLGLDGSAVGLLYNPYAAMPSLHVGWSLLAGVALLVCARSWWLKAAGVALPVLMTLTVLVTANHYLLDVLAGVAVALVAPALAWWWSMWKARRATPSSATHE